MENVTNQLKAEYKPRMVLAIYKANMYRGDYIESHVVDNKGRVLAGKPLDHRTMDEILKGFERSKKKEKPVIGGMIPPGLLLADQQHGRYVWHTPPMQRALYFSPGLQIPDGLAWVPALIFSAKHNSLKVLAIKNFNGSKTKIFKCPFHNVSPNGGVCLGSAATEMRGHSYTDVLEYWEKIFFASIFTHLSADKSPIKGNLNTMWKKLIQTGEKFDNEVLIEAKIKLEDLLQ